MKQITDRMWWAIDIVVLGGLLPNFARYHTTKYKSDPLVNEY